MPPRDLTAVFATIKRSDLPMLKRAAASAGMTLSVFVRMALNDALEDSGECLTELKDSGRLKTDA